MPLQLVVQPLQLGDVGSAGLGGGFVRAAPFQQRHHREQVVGVFVRQLDDTAAALRHQFHQAFGGQHLQRLAQLLEVHDDCAPISAAAFISSARRRSFSRR